jgi:hypothetical protein
VGSNYFLLLHAITIPFIVVHWLFSDNTCFLTLVERNLRKKIDSNYDDDNCFTCKLIEPVYDFNKNNEDKSTFIYSVTGLLWIIAVGRLYYKYNNGEITDWRDFMR